MYKRSPLFSALLLLSVGLPIVAMGCSAPEGQPARRTTVRTGPSRTAPARPAPQRVTIHPLWEVKTGHQQARLAQVKYGCLLVLGGQYVAHGTPQRELLCLAPADGKVRWRWRGGQAPLTVAAAHSAVVTLRDAVDKHHFVDARTGRKVDRPKGILPARGTTPLEVDGHRYTVEGHTVRCVDARTGATIWESPTRGPAVGLRVVGRTIYYAVGGERAIHARNARSGLGLWLHQVRPQPGVKNPRAANFSFAVRKGRLYVARYDGTVGAFALRRAGSPRRAAPRPAPRRGQKE